MEPFLCMTVLFLAKVLDNALGTARTIFVQRNKPLLTESEQDETIRRTLELMELIDSGPDFPEAFDRELFGELVEKMVVDSGECLHFRLKNGLELAETMERTVR